MAQGLMTAAVQIARATNCTNPCRVTFAADQFLMSAAAYHWPYIVSQYTNIARGLCGVQIVCEGDAGCVLFAWGGEKHQCLTSHVCSKEMNPWEGKSSHHIMFVPNSALKHCVPPPSLIALSIRLAAAPQSSQLSRPSQLQQSALLRIPASRGTPRTSAAMGCSRHPPQEQQYVTE